MLLTNLLLAGITLPGFGLKVFGSSSEMSLFISISILCVREPMSVYSGAVMLSFSKPFGDLFKRRGSVKGLMMHGRVRHDW